MNWHETLNLIYSKLEYAGFEDAKEKIFQGQLSGATGGEILSIVLSILAEIKQNQPNVYSVIKEEADSLREYGREIGYL